MSEKKKKKTLEERLRDRQADIKNKQGSFKYFTFKPGTTKIRVLNTGEENEFGMEVMFVFLNKDLGGFVSPSTFGEKCYAKKVGEQLAESKKESERNLAKKLKPKRKFIIVAAKYNDQDQLEENNVKPALLTPGQMNELIDLFLDPDNGDFTHPEEGYDVKMKRVGEGLMDTKYSILRGKSGPLPKWLKKKLPVDLEAAIRELTPSYKETKRLVEAFLNLPQEDEDDEQPKKKKKKPRDEDGDDLPF